MGVGGGGGESRTRRIVARSFHLVVSSGKTNISFVSLILFLIQWNLFIAQKCNVLLHLFPYSLVSLHRFVGSWVATNANSHEWQGEVDVRLTPFA